MLRISRSIFHQSQAGTSGACDFPPRYNAKGETTKELDHEIRFGFWVSSNSAVPDDRICQSNLSAVFVQLQFVPWSFGDRISWHSSCHAVCCAAGCPLPPAPQPLETGLQSAAGVSYADSNNCGGF